MSTVFVDIKQWIFFCVDCNRLVLKAKSGLMVEACAKVHYEKTGHYCLVGYSVEVKK